MTKQISQNSRCDLSTLEVVLRHEHGWSTVLAEEGTSSIVAIGRQAST